MITILSKLFEYVAFLMNYSFQIGNLSIKIWYAFAFSIVLNILMKMILPTWTGGISSLKPNKHYHKSASDIHHYDNNNVTLEKGTFIVYKNNEEAHIK